MKGTRIAVVAILAICILLCVQSVGAMTIKLAPFAGSDSKASASVASVNDNYPLSVDQAKDSIRAFAGDLSLDPVLTYTGSMEIGNYYYFTTDDATFSVNQNSGVVEFAHFGANEPNSTELTLTHDEALAKANEYAGSKYADYSTRTWKTIADQIDTGYDWVYNPSTGHWDRVETQKTYNFVFREEKEHVLLPNLVHVSVNPKTGAIIDYWGVDRLITVSNLKSTVSLGTATKTAEDAVYSEFTTTSSEGYLAVVTQYQNVETLAWVLKLHGHFSWDPDYESTYEVVVSADDGSMLGYGWDNIWPEHQLYYYS